MGVVSSMLSDRSFAALGLTALVAVGLAASPALSASDSATTRAAALSALVGRFTPATGEPKLLARYANLSAEARRNFRFTPAMARSENRAVTLVRRVTPATVTGTADTGIGRGPQQISITPVTYRLGSAVGYTSFATAIDRTSVDIAALPAARRPVDPTDRPSRFGADMRLDSRSLPGASERALDPDRAYSVDVTGSYRLSRNVDVTAGVRLQRENDRLAPLTDERQDSQAVYVGTQFRF
jgi:hypothetical protein